MKATCTHCHAPLPEEAKFCPECGTAVQVTVVCPDCGQCHPPGSKFCSSCGKPLPVALRQGSGPGRQNEHTGGLSRSQLTILLSIGLIAGLICGIYYYLNFIEPLAAKEKVDPHQQTAGQASAQQTTGQNSELQAPGNLHTQEEIDQLKAQVEQSPDDVELNIHMGNILFDNGRFAEAIPYYRKALQLEPNNPDVIVDLGVCYFNLKNYPAAKEQFQLALTSNPQHVNALYNMGVVAVQLGDVNELIHYWTKLHEVAPNSEQARRAMEILDQIHQQVEAGKEGAG